MEIMLFIAVELPSFAEARDFVLSSKRMSRAQLELACGFCLAADTIR
jgi:hypothetical protein